MEVQSEKEKRSPQGEHTKQDLEMPKPKRGRPKRVKDQPGNELMTMQAIQIIGAGDIIPIDKNDDMNIYQKFVPYWMVKGPHRHKSIRNEQCRVKCGSLACGTRTCKEAKAMAPCFVTKYS
ncbi:hypothetical protein GBA52_021860 [Prunus armeniaca]|nr:hypothetical protein GBA52_021860 [Prunus armeniaca]